MKHLILAALAGLVLLAVPRTQSSVPVTAIPLALDTGEIVAVVYRSDWSLQVVDQNGSVLIDNAKIGRAQQGGGAGGIADYIWSREVDGETLVVQVDCEKKKLSEENCLKLFFQRIRALKKVFKLE